MSTDTQVVILYLLLLVYHIDLRQEMHNHGHFHYRHKTHDEAGRLVFFCVCFFLHPLRPAQL